MEPNRVETHQVPKGKGSRVEQLADNFAAALLMPGSTVRELWETRAEGADVYEWLNRTATRLRVSALALSYRVLNLDLVSRSEFEAIDPERLVANGDPGGQNPPPPLLPGVRGPLYNAVENGRLSEEGLRAPVAGQRDLRGSLPPVPADPLVRGLMARRERWARGAGLRRHQRRHRGRPPWLLGRRFRRAEHRRSSRAGARPKRR